MRDALSRRSGDGAPEPPGPPPTTAPRPTPRRTWRRPEQTVTNAYNSAMIKGFVLGILMWTAITAASYTIILFGLL